MSELIMSARNLVKSYGSTQAMRGISLDIVRGEVLAIMGQSGSGKSTLLHSLAGIEVPDAGEVLYAGNDVAKLSDKERTLLRRREFGFVFQFSQLVPELSALDNIAVPLLLDGKSRHEAYQQAGYWLNAVGLTERAKHLPGQLSGGEAQRIAIARALCPNPKLLFADEPTGSLDTLNSEHVMTMLIELVKANGMTVVLVTHEPTIAAYADREVVVRDGLVSA